MAFLMPTTTCFLRMPMPPCSWTPSSRQRLLLLRLHRVISLVLRRERVVQPAPHCAVREEVLRRRRRQGARHLLRLANV